MARLSGNATSEWSLQSVSVSLVCGEDLVPTYILSKAMPLLIGGAALCEVCDPHTSDATYALAGSEASGDWYAVAGDTWSRLNDLEELSISIHNGFTKSAISLSRTR